MSKQVAQKLIDRAVEYQLAKLAREIAELPDDQISAKAPAIKLLREYLGIAA